MNQPSRNTSRDRIASAKPSGDASNLAERVAGKDQSETRRRVALLVAFVFAVFAAVNLAQGINAFVGTTNFLASATQTAGEITGYAPSDRRNARIPIVRYQAADGRSYTVNATFDCGSTCPPIGGAMPVAYQPGTPADAMVNDFANTWLPAAQSMVISFVGLLITVVAFLFSRPPVRR